MTGRPRVLVVDDSEVIRELIRVNLQLDGFDVFEAVDGLDALDKVHAAAPDIITLDVRMPRLDGFLTAERIRADDRTRHVPIAMVSACEQESDRQRGRDVGVDAYVAKPFDPAVLVSAVRRLLAAGRADC